MLAVVLALAAGAHFRNEQESVVGPTLTAAVPELRWPLVRFFALRPVVSFAYFPLGHRLWFNNFANREERIANGLKAFSLAAQVGWSTTEAALSRYSTPRHRFASDLANATAISRALMTAKSCSN